MSPAKVALVRCERYEDDLVADAVAQGFELLGGVSRFVTPGENLLLKPNLLAGTAPEALVTTHPTVFRAVAKSLKAAGARLTYGDSPGFGQPKGAARKAGLVDVAEEENIPLADFVSGELVSFPEGKLIKQFTIAKGALAADGIVSLPKFKTHGLSRMTGAVKNQFGCIPGARKSEFHVRMADIVNFSQMLVDLNRLLRPRLYVMDGIIAMQGNGPRSGDPYEMSALLMSDDPVALDATMCRMADLDIQLVGTVTYGDEWGLGKAGAEDIEILGEPLESFVAPDFEVNRSKVPTTLGSGRMRNAIKQRIVPRPAIDPKQCTKCGTCVKVCPVDPKAVDFRGSGTDGDKPVPSYDYGRCIRCYCCQEMCPEHAIELQKPMLRRLISR